MGRWQVFVWILAPGAVAVALVATTVSLFKRRWIWFTLGLAATALAVTVMVSSWSASSEGFEDLALAAAFVYLEAPLIALAIIGSLGKPRPGSWWMRRTSSGAAVGTEPIASPTDV